MVALINEKNGILNKNTTFEQLFGILKDFGIDIPNVNVLKNLNAQRILVKHHGQLSEPLSIASYAEACEETIELLVQQVLGVGLRQVFLADRLEEGEIKGLLVQAETLIREGSYLYALVEIRKAIFVGIENDYCIHNFENAIAHQGIFAQIFWRGGIKAPFWAKNSLWIAANVYTPFDFVQIDQDRLRLDCIEWGFSPADFLNLLRLTPAVFRSNFQEPWKVKFESQYWGLSDSANANYCLDRAIDVLVKQQQHKKIQKSNFPDGPRILGAEYKNSPIFLKARKDSALMGHVLDSGNLTISYVGDGFFEGERYICISGMQPEQPGGQLKFFSGFIEEHPAPSIP